VTEVLDASRNGKRDTTIREFRISEGLSLRDVKFSYPECEKCIKGMSIDLNCGESAVIVGPTGSGKTTLLRLMAGMYDQYDGVIAADSVPISQMRLSAYQANAAMVMADNFFFSGTIMDNMRMAGRHVTEDSVHETAEILGIDKWLRSLPNGYDTRLGVGGIRLSSGQTQKVAILRAVLKRPRLLLLDEVTSAMDVESERYILDGLKRLRPPDCMTVLTTHRLTLTMEPWIDTVIVIDDGRITEKGNPRELYHAESEYRRLMNLAGLGSVIWREVGEKVK
jgi:ATP-binding cassette subfamily B protein